MSPTKQHRVVLDSTFTPFISHDAVRGIMVAISLLFFLIIIGTAGYHILEEWSFFDSLYMTVITIATVGYGEVQNLSFIGRLFTIFLIAGGIGVGGYAIGTIAAFLTEGQLLNIMRGRKMAKEITMLKDHIIVCGYGKIGREVCLYLAEFHESFIVLDTDENKIDEALQHGYIAAVGDASEEDILIRAGIKNAKALISAISDNSANVYLVLTARSLNESMLIVSRSTDAGSQKKLLRVGANRVVSPFEMGARRIAAHILRPNVIEFIDAFSFGSQYGLHMQKINIDEGSSLVGKRLDESYIKRDTKGCLIVGIEKNGKMTINPSGNTVLEKDDDLLALGTDEQLLLLNKLAQ